MRRLLWGVSVLAGTALVLAACSSGSNDSASAGDVAAPGRHTEARALSAADQDGGAGGGQSADNAKASTATVALTRADVPGIDRSIVYTADLSVTVKHADRAVDAATSAVERAGGYLFKQRATLDGTPTVVVTYKVPPSRFQRVVRELGALGKVTQRRVDAQDVTGRVVDLQARVDATRTSTERLRALLAESGGVGDLLTVERELATREGELESLEGQLATLRSQVDAATVTATFTTRAAPARHESTRELPAFGTGLRNGAGAFVNVVKVGGATIGFALPFLPLLAAAGGLWLVIARQMRRRAGAPSA
jgi:hypothetical protein